jgi:hypothetical protein
MNVLVVLFSVTFLTATPQIEVQPDVDLIVFDDEEELIPRPMLDPDFESDLRDYCKYEDIDESHLDRKE